MEFTEEKKREEQNWTTINSESPESLLSNSWLRNTKCDTNVGFHVIRGNRKQVYKVGAGRGTSCRGTFACGKGMHPQILYGYTIWLYILSIKHSFLVKLTTYQESYGYVNLCNDQQNWYIITAGPYKVIYTFPYYICMLQEYLILILMIMDLKLNYIVGFSFHYLLLCQRWIW